MSRCTHIPYHQWSNAVFYYIHDPQPPSKSQATCKLQHTIPLPLSYKRHLISRLPMVVYSIKPPGPHTHKLLPCTPFPITFYDMLHRSILLYPLHAPQRALLDLQRPRARPPATQVRHAHLPPSVPGVFQGKMCLKRWRRQRS